MTPRRDMYAGYVSEAGNWLPVAPEWAEIREAPIPMVPGEGRVWRLRDGGKERLGYWGRHPFEADHEGWLSAIDPTIMLTPTHFRDLVCPMQWAPVVETADG